MDEQLSHKTRVNTGTKRLSSDATRENMGSLPDVDLTAGAEAGCASGRITVLLQTVTQVFNPARSYRSGVFSAVG
jgi:hypothetical protein